MDVGPESVRSFLLADEMFGAADEAEERVEGFGLEGDGSAGFFQETVSGVEFEVGEAIGGLGGALIFFENPCAISGLECLETSLHCWQK